MVQTVVGSSTALTAFNSDGFSTGNEQTYNNNSALTSNNCWKGGVQLD